MSTGDAKQNQHDVYGALAAHEQQIADHTADWHVYHQAGVLLSTLAERAWVAHRPGWEKSVRDYLSRALGYSTDASERTNDVMAEAAITCDRALTLARQARLGSAFAESIAIAEGLANRVIAELESLQRLGSGNKQLFHQLAIAHDVLARVALIELQGFGPNVLARPELVEHIDIARRLFEFELDPDDDQRAYRSFLCAMAVGYDEGGQPAIRRLYAKLAIRSARRYNDRTHLIRARAIYWLGWRGQRWLLLLRRSA